MGGGTACSCPPAYAPLERVRSVTFGQALGGVEEVQVIELRLLRQVRGVVHSRLLPGHGSNHPMEGNHEVHLGVMRQVNLQRTASSRFTMVRTTKEWMPAL